MMELVNEANLTPAQSGAFGIAHADRGLTGDIHLSRIGLFEKAGDMEKRRFAGAGGRDQRDGLPCPQAKIRAAQNFERRARLVVAAFELVEMERRSGHGYS